MSETATIDVPFTPIPPRPVKEVRYLPPGLRRKVITIGGNDYAKQSEEWGLYKVRITRQCLELHGACLSVGQVVELPGNVAHCLWSDRLCEFVKDERTEQEDKILADAKKLGFEVTGKPKALKDRPEFQHLTKKKNWVASSYSEESRT